MADDTQLMNYLNARPKLVARPHLLALSAFLASAPLYSPNAQLLGHLTASRNELGNFQLAMALSCVVAALFLIARPARRPTRPPAGGKASLGCAVGYALTQIALLVLLAKEGDQSAVLALLGAAAGILVVPVILAWIRCYAIDLRNAMFYGAIACAASAVFTWVASLLPDFSASVALGLLSVVGAVAPVLPAQSRACATNTDSPFSSDRGPRVDAETTRPGFVASVRGLLSIIWPPLLGFLLYVFMTTIYSFPTNGLSVSTEFTGSVIASALAIAICLLPHQAPLVILIDRLIIPICVAVCLVLGSFPNGSPMFVLGAYTVYVPLVFMTIYALSSLIIVSAAGEFPLTLIVGVALITSNATALFATLISQTFGAVVNFGSVTWTLICIYFAISIIALGYSSWRKAVSPAGSDETDAVTSVQATMDQHEAMYYQQVLELARTHDLTERETQILSYLGRGYNSTYVAQCLFISANTVRTHARSIYRKLGVTTRTELLALLEHAQPQE